MRPPDQSNNPQDAQDEEEPDGTLGRVHERERVDVWDVGLRVEKEAREDDLAGIGAKDVVEILAEPGLLLDSGLVDHIEDVAETRRRGGC